jgi:hypothetical protein
VIPTTLLGLLVFAASVGPGYVYVSVAERHKLRRTRSALLEASEVLSVGGVASLVSLLFWLFVAEETNWLDLKRIPHGAADYIAAYPVRTLGFPLVVLATSYGLAWGVARRRHRNLPESIGVGSVWYSQIGDEGGTRYVYGTAELRDGRSIYGQIVSFTLDEAEEERQVSFGRPLRVKQRGGDWVDFPSLDCIIVDGEDVLTLAVQYRNVVNALTAAS